MVDPFTFIYNLKFCWYTKKKRGSLSVTRPTLWGSGIALIVERATPKPTPVCKYTVIIAESQSWLTAIKDTDITYPWASLLPCSWLSVKELPDSRVSSTKRKITLFLIYRSPPSPAPPASEASVWRHCKDKKIISIHKIFDGKSYGIRNLKISLTS